MTFAAWLELEPFSLAMSSGFFGFFAHTGMLAALVEAGLRPRRVTGSSAGALVAGAYLAGLDPEELARELLRVKRADFWDPRPGLGLLRGARFQRELTRLLGTMRLEDGRVPASLVVHDVLAHRAVARSSGPLVETIAASCAVPLLFAPVFIDGRPYLDGGILDRPGTSPLAVGERALHHHLASRSPWRRVDSSALVLRERPARTTLVLDGLPRSGPFRLEVGALAYERARAATRLALCAPHAPIMRLAA